MYYLIIDTCVWMDLAKDHPSVLQTLRRLVEQKKAVLIVTETVIEEWQRKTPTVIQNWSQPISSATNNVEKLFDLLRKFLPDMIGEFPNIIDKVREMSSLVKPVVNDQIALIESLFNYETTICLEIALEAKLRAVDFALTNKKPFSKSKNSMADALILFTALHYASEHRLENCLFVSSNSSDFGKSEQIHEDLKDLFDSCGMRYFSNGGKAINEIEAGLVSEIEIEEIEQTQQESVAKRATAILDTFMPYETSAIRAALDYQARTSGAVDPSIAYWYNSKVFDKFNYNDTAVENSVNWVRAKQMLEANEDSIQSVKDTLRFVKREYPELYADYVSGRSDDDEKDK